MRDSRLPAAVLAVLLFARAVPAAAAGEWTRLNSDHFELYTSAGEKKGREAILNEKQRTGIFYAESWVRRSDEREESPQPVIAKQVGPVVIEGTLRQVDCAGDVARVTIDSGGKAVRLAIHDPGKIVIRNSDSGKVDFQCGPQKPRPVLIEYEKKPDEDMDTIGVIRAIEFR